jgi:hypothetical protein
VKERIDSMKTYLKMTSALFCLSILIPVAAKADASGASTNTVTTSADRGLIAWGTVDSVTANQVVIRDQNKEMTPYILSDQTKYKGMNPSDLKVGTEVRIEYGPADNVANLITRKPAE